MISINDSKTRVIIFGQHAWNTLGQIRSFGELGLRPDVVWVKGDLVVPSKSKYINQFHIVDSFEDGLNCIKHEYTDRNYSYVISTDSDVVVSLFDLHYDELKERFYFFNASQQGRLNQFLPKHAQYQLAKKYGLKVPKTEIVKKGFLPHDLNYPIITKTIDSFTRNWKDNYVICHSEQELLDAYKLINQDNLLLQEFIEKKNEVAIEGISIKQGEDIYIPVQGEYIRVEPGGYGSWKRNEIYHLGEEMRDKIQQIIKEIKFSGVFEMEFLKDKNDNLYFLEINFRHTQYNHALADMGVNMSKLLLEGFLNNYLCVDNLIIKSPHIVMNERRDFDTYIRTNKISLRSWLSDIRKTDSFYIYDRYDRYPFYDYIFSLIKGHISLFFRKIRIIK